MNQNPRRWPKQGPLQFQQSRIAPDKTVGILAVLRFRRQFRFLDHRLAAVARKTQIRWVLLVHHRHQPILQRESASRADSPILFQHRLPPGPQPFRHVAGLEQTPVKRGQKLLRAADVQGIRHRHHAADARPQQAGRYRGKGILGPIIHHRRLTGVQHHHRNAMLAQQRAELIGGHQIGLAVLIFKNQQPLRPLEKMGRTAACRRSITAVTVEMDNVIISGPLAQMLAQMFEGRRPQNRHPRRQLPLFDPFHHRPRQGTETHVALKRPSGDEQDIDAIARQTFRQGQRIVTAIQLALDPAMMGQRAGMLRIGQRLPRPRQHAGIVAGDAQIQILQTLPIGVVIKIPALTRAEQGGKRSLAPAAQCFLNALGPVGVRRKGI